MPSNSSPESLSTASYVILGLVEWLEPCTSYDMKREVARSIQHFWSFSHTTLYLEPARLVDAGLLTREQEDDGRRRRLYRITPAGHALLAEWRRDAAARHLEVHDLGVLKLFFADHTDQAALQRLVQDQRALHEERLAAFGDVMRRFQDRADLSMKLATLELGLKFEALMAEFWQDVDRRRRTAPPAPARTRNDAG
jgi:DNA-binding PadR family transcriptional regulator